MNCAVCNKTETVSEMTTGRHNAPLCDDCRDMVVTFFFIYRDLNKAVIEVRKAKGFHND